MSEQLKVLGVIPARGGSKAVPNKNIRKLKGKPLIQYTIDAAKKSDFIDKLVVSSDDDKILSIAEDLDIISIKRPDYMATDEAPLEDSLRHAVGYLKDNENYVPDIIVLMQANVPIRKEGVIDETISKIIDHNSDSATTVYEVDQRPEWMKKDNAGFLKPFVKPTNQYRRQDLPKLYLIDGAVMAMTHKSLFAVTEKKIHSFMGEKIAYVIQEKIYSIEIDEEDDFFLAEAVMNKILND